MDLFELSAKIELDTDEYEKSVKDASKTAEKVEDSLKGAGKAADKTEDSIGGLGKTSKKTSKETDGLGKSTENVKDSFVGSIVKADLFTDALEKVGEMAMEVAQYIWGLDEATADYRASQAKLNTAFKVSGFSADTARSAFRGLYRVVGDIDQATEASQLLSQLALTTEDISKWTTIATGVYGTFGDSLPIESLIESANETARVGQVTGALADALNWAGQVGEDEFNAMLADCGTQAERVSMITETLSGTYEGAAETFAENNGILMEARDALIEVQEASAGAGEEIANLKNSLKAGASQSMKGFYALIQHYAGALSDTVEASNNADASFNQWMDSVEKRLKTGTVEEATQAWGELVHKLEWFKEHPIESAVQSGGLLARIGAIQDLDPLLDLGIERFNGTAEAAELAATQEERLAAASTEVVEAIEPVILTADGLSQSIEYTGTNAEEAAARLQTYADAATNMFSKISEESELSYQDMVANLEANVLATQNFAKNMESIAGVLPAELAEMFYAGGPAMYAGTVAMLAQANAGADVGLEQLKTAYDQGGQEAIDLFMQSIGQVPENTQDPAKVIAAQMEEDTSMETASVGVVDRTASATADAVSSAGFDSSGALAMMKFIAGMEAQRSAIMAKARDLAQAAKREIDSALDGIGGRGGYGRAGGLDYVPYNGYPAVLHAGEAVLTAREADQWRSGRSQEGGRQIVIHQHINAVPQTPAQFAAATQAYFQEAVWAL